MSSNLNCSSFSFRYTRQTNENGWSLGGPIQRRSEERREFTAEICPTGASASAEPTRAPERSSDSTAEAASRVFESMSNLASTFDREHTIQPGDTLSGLAQQYNMPMERLLEANPQITNPDLIYAGDTLNIPRQVDDADPGDTFDRSPIRPAAPDRPSQTRADSETSPASSQLSPEQEAQAAQLAEDVRGLMNSVTLDMMRMAIGGRGRSCPT